jgi:hypothetical protein
VAALLANVTSTNVPLDLVNQLNSMNDDIAKTRVSDHRGFGPPSYIVAQDTCPAL